MRHRRRLTAVLPASRSWARRRRRPPSPKKTVRIGDNYYLPDAVKVKRGTIVTWNWPGFDEAGDVHDVKLKSGPKGVKKFHSEAGVDRLHVQAQAEEARQVQDRLHAPRGDAHDDPRR